MAEDAPLITVRSPITWPAFPVDSWYCCSMNLGRNEDIPANRSQSPASARDIRVKIGFMRGLNKRIPSKSKWINFITLDLTPLGATLLPPLLPSCMEDGRHPKLLSLE